MATLAIAAVGSYIGGTAITGTILGMTGAQIGWMAGSMLGSYLFAPDMGDQHGPRLEDLAVSTASEGTDIPFILGTYIVPGKIIAAADIQEQAHKEETGKGGGGGSYTTYTYTATFAVSLGEFISKGPLKILLNKKPIFDETQELDQATGETPVIIDDTIIWHFYDGTQTEPSTVLEAIYGEGNVPAYLGQTYIVFEDLLLTDFGNRVPSVEVVISTDENKIGSTIEFPFAQAVADQTVLTFAEADAEFSGVGGGDNFHMEYAECTGLYSYMHGTATGSPIDFVFFTFDPVTHDFKCRSFENSDYRTSRFGMYSTEYNPLGWNDVMLMLNSNKQAYGFYDTATGELLFQIPSAAGSGEAQFASSPPINFETETHLYDLYSGSVYIYPKRNMEADWWWFYNTDLGSTYNYRPTDRTVYTRNNTGNDVVDLIAFKANSLDPSVICMVTVTKSTLNSGHRYNIIVSDERALTTIDPSYLGLIEDATSVAAYNTDALKAYYDEQEDRTWGFWAITNPNYGGSAWYIIKLNTVTGEVEKAIPVLNGFYVAGSRANSPVVSFNREARRFSGMNDSGIWFYDIDTDTLKEEYDTTGYEGPLASYHAPTATYVGSQLITDGANVFMSMTRIVNTPSEYSIADICEDLANRAGISSSLIDKSGMIATVPGFAHTRVTSARGDMEPLLAYAQTDAFIHNGKLSFKPRGGSSDMSIAYDDLGAKVGNLSDENTYKQDLPQDIDAPLYYTLNYLSIENDFQAGLAIANHPLSLSKQHKSVSLPLLLHDAIAMEFIDIVLQQDIEKGVLEFNLLEKYIELEPTDIATITLEDTRQLRVRILNIDTGADGLIKVKAVLDYTEHQISHAQAGGSVAEPALIRYVGDPVPYILDLPLLLDTEADQISPYLAASASGEIFPLVLFFRALAGTNNFSDATSIAEEAVAGNIVEAPTDIATFEEKDITNTLTVVLNTGTLASISEAEALNGENAFAWGHNGRWEIVTFQTAVLIGSNTYTISNFFRGRRGTNTKCNLHKEGDLFILLTTGTITKENIPVSMLGQEILYKAIPAGQITTNYRSHLFTISDTPLLPYSPIAPTTVEDGATTNNLTLSATSRRRKNGSLGGVNNVTDGIGTDPDVTAFRFVIMDEDDIVKATVDQSSLPYEYSSAQQVTDFGSLPLVIKWKVAPISSLVTDVSKFSEVYTFTRPNVPTLSIPSWVVSGDDISPRVYSTYT